MKTTPRAHAPANNKASRRPHVINPNAVYFREDLSRLLRLPLDAIREEIAAGRLRVAEARGRYRFLGAWLLEWIASTELSSRRPGRPVSSGVANRPIKEDD